MRYDAKLIHFYGKSFH